MALSTLQGALELGLIYAILAFGVYISFRILDIPDLSVDGTFITGCGAAAICTLNGHPYLGVFAALIAGALAGGVTGFLQTLNILITALNTMMKKWSSRKAPNMVHGFIIK